MRVIISPYSKQMRNGMPHPKNYPFWREFIDMMRVTTNGKCEIIQIGTAGEERLVEDCRFNLPFKDLKELLESADAFICVDNFLHHFAHYYGIRGIVIFGQSDPNLFGYKENVNLLKDRKYLRDKQFWWWEQAEFNQEAFVAPEIVLYELMKFTIQTKKPDIST